MTFLILVIIILGWIVFEQFSNKKQQDERNQRFKDIEITRNQNFKKSPQFLNNTLKLNSIFKKLTTANIQFIKIGHFREFNDKVWEVEKEINLIYKAKAFSITLSGAGYGCVAYIYAKHSNSDIRKIQFSYIDDDNIIIEKIIRIIETEYNEIYK